MELGPILALFLILMKNHHLSYWRWERAAGNSFLSPMIAECAGPEEGTEALVVPYRGSQLIPGGKEGKNTESEQQTRIRQGSLCPHSGAQAHLGLTSFMGEAKKAKAMV